MDSNNSSFESWVHVDIVNHLCWVTPLDIRWDPGTVLVPKPFSLILVEVLNSQSCWELTKMTISSLHVSELSNLPVFVIWECHLPPLRAIWLRTMLVDTISASQLWM